MKRKIIMFAIGLVLLIASFALFYLKMAYIPNDYVKKAVQQSEILESSYIFCKRARITGFDWQLVKNEYGNESNVFINIVGTSPFEDLEFSHEFVMSDNTYIFYIEERRDYYSEELKQDCVEYIVTGWDILYPVKHATLLGMFEPNTCITERDIIK